MAVKITFICWQKPQIHITIKTWLFLGARPACTPNPSQICDCENTQRYFCTSRGPTWGTPCQCGPQPRRADVTTAQIWKSLHIVAAIAVAVLTREREISTCPHHIPALALNNTHLLSRAQVEPSIPCRKKKEKKKPHTLSKDLFGYFVKSWRQVTVELPRYPNQMWGSTRYSRNLKCLSWIIWHRSSKTWRTARKPEDKKEDGWPSQLSDSTALHGVKEEEYCHGGATRGIHLTFD